LDFNKIENNIGFQKIENNFGFQNKSEMILDFKTNRKTMLAFKKTENYISVQKDEFEMSDIV